MGIRKEVIFRGRVQGVCFRHTTYQIATKERVVGRVWNNLDGSVGLIIEGEETKVNRVLGRVKWKYVSNIEDLEQVQREPIGEFSDFSIQRAS